MNNMRMNTEQLSNLTEQIREINKDFDNLFRQLKNDNEILKDYWISNTSETIYSDLPTFYNRFEKTINDFNEDIKFLEKTKARYELNEKTTSKVIDEKIAI